MAQDTLTFRTTVKQADQALCPSIPDMVVPNCIINIPNKITIPAGAIEYPLHLDDNEDSAMRVLVLITNPVNEDKLSCTVNDSTKIDYIAPFQVYSEDLEQVLISNSDEDNDLVLWVFNAPEVTA